MNDLISRKYAIAHLKKRLYETQLNNDTDHPYYEEIADNRIDTWMNEVPFAQPNPSECWGCNCLKLGGIVEQKHGRWIVTNIPNLTSTAQDVVTFTRQCRCSECGALFGRESDNYCYNCGAIMDMGRE